MVIEIAPVARAAGGGAIEVARGIADARRLACRGNGRVVAGGAAAGGAVRVEQRLTATGRDDGDHECAR